jgi:hypothetical protein
MIFRLLCAGLLLVGALSLTGCGTCSHCKGCCPPTIASASPCCPPACPTCPGAAPCCPGAIAPTPP